mgnify:CR=1 FL=1
MLLNYKIKYLLAKDLDNNITVAYLAKEELMVTH